MAGQGFLDGLGAWAGQRIDRFGSEVADNITGGAEKQPDMNNPEEQTGKPTPQQQLAGKLPAILQDTQKMMIVGGAVLAVVAVVAMTGARR